MTRFMSWRSVHLAESSIVEPATPAESPTATPSSFGWYSPANGYIHVRTILRSFKGY